MARLASIVESGYHLWWCCDEMFFRRYYVAAVAKLHGLRLTIEDAHPGAA